jgi:hypothetical protein
MFEKRASMVSTPSEKVAPKPTPYAPFVPSIVNLPGNSKDPTREHMNLDHLSNLLSGIQKEVSAIKQIQAENLENLQDLKHAKDLAKEVGDAK